MADCRNEISMLNTSSKLRSRILGLLVIVIGCIIGFEFALGMNSGKIKTVALILVLPFILFLPFWLSRVDQKTIVSVLLLLFWLPIPIYFLNQVFPEFYLFELTIYCTLALAVVNRFVFRDTSSEQSFKGFPSMAFLFFVGGGILTFAISSKIGTELVRIRVFCLFPMILCLFFFLTVRNENDAHRYLWIIYISSSLLALLFNIASRFISFMRTTDYALDSGRLSMELKIPFLDVLRILPASTGTYFGMILCVGFYLFLSSVRTNKMLIIIGLLLVLALALILGQARGGAAAAICSIAMMALLHFRKTNTKTHLVFAVIGLP